MALQFLRSLYRHPLGRKNPLSVLGRYVHWQLHHRLASDTLAFPYVNGTSLKARHKWPVITGNYYFGLLEFEPMAFVLHALRSDVLFVDVGAHVGSYTVAAASVGARVLAVEPQKNSRVILQEHLAMNGLSELVTICDQALGAEQDIVRMQQKGQQSHITSVSDHGTSEVRMTTLDVLLRDKNPEIIKIDAEGFELKILQGASSTIADNTLKAVLVETMGLGRRYGDDDAQVIQTLKDAGFSSMRYDPFNRTLEPTTDPRAMHLMVRDPDWARSRVRAAPEVRIGKKGAV